jgi:heptosyltransferase III
VSAPRVLVVHSGALGDCVLVWPLLRALVRDGSKVTLAARGSHARLTARHLGEPIIVMDVEHPTLNALWRGESHPAGAIAADVVLTFLADDGEPIGAAWHEAARRALGANEVLYVPAPGTSGRAAMWARFHVERRGKVQARSNALGPVVIHTGAGSRVKMWPMEHIAELANALRSRGRQCDVLAGEVEAELFSQEERRLFGQLSGECVLSLDVLAERLASAGVYVGADTGPTHLAAQLGICTLALFGPTDPKIWRPVGPCVRVLAAPGASGEMHALAPSDVLNAIEEMFSP